MKLLLQPGSPRVRDMSIRSALPARKFWRGAACSPRWSLDILHRPKGETENSPCLQAWEGLRKENRPERAADFRALFRKGNLRQTRLDNILRNYESLLAQKSAGTIR